MEGEDGSILAIFAFNALQQVHGHTQSMMRRVNGVVVVAAGALAATVNTFEHGGQVGMVSEMYRNCAGFFTLLEESIESTPNESEAGKREIGDIFESKVALEFGRSVPELRDLGRSTVSRIYGSETDEFPSKLF